MYKRIIDLKNSSRSWKIALNVLGSFTTKGLGAIIGFLVIPLQLVIISNSEFGLWQTLSSMLTWFFFLDFGLGNGFRNYFTKAIAEKNDNLARVYLSTTFYIVLLVALVCYFLFELLYYSLPWSIILNFDINGIERFGWIVHVLFISFFLRLVFSFVNTALMASHFYFLSTALELIGSLLVLFFTWTLAHNASHSFLNLAIITSIIPLVILVLGNFYFFNLGPLKIYKPKIKYFDYSIGKQMLKKGVQFLALQLAYVLIFFTNNIIVSQLFGPEKVTTLSLISKYFSVPTLLFGIILAPFWAGFADAYLKADFGWIKASIKRLLLIWMLFNVGIVLMLIFSKLVLNFWLGANHKFELIHLILYGILTAIISFNSIFVMFINGVGKIRFQLWLSLFLGFINVPLTFFMGSWINLGLTGILVSNILITVLGSFFGPFQYLLIIKQKARSIWDK
jgi:O-antigen/teichoic acid export membrane protein